MNIHAGMTAVILLSGFVALSGCTGPAEPIWDSDFDVARSIYRDDGPSSLTLITVINNKSGSGAHSALMVNGSQRVIFDPAGSWHHPKLPERNDVHFGITDAVADFYVDYHSRITFHTIVQEIQVSPAVAEIALREVMAYGAVPKAQCSKSVSEILARVPGFENLTHTWFPRQLSKSFATLPGVKTDRVFDNDPDDNSGLIQAPGVFYNQVN